MMSGELAVTWWGHASTTVELGGVRVGIDPLFVDRLLHLRRYGRSPTRTAADVDLVLISHLHNDHLHPRSLARVRPGTTIVAPRGARPYLRAVRDHPIVEVTPGQSLALLGLRIDVVAAKHDDRRNGFSRRRALPVGYRVSDDLHACWYPGDTGLHDAMSQVRPVDLALVPIGGWGPTLGPDHMDPEEAAVAVDRVGSSWAVPVHYGTFWPIGLRQLVPANHRRLFVSAAPRFASAMESSSAAAVVLEHGERAVLSPGTGLE